MAEDTTPQDDAKTTEGVVQDEQLGEAGMKALQSERKARAAAEKRINELAEQIRAREEADLSELQKAQNAQRAAEEAATEARTEALRWRIATRYGIADEDAEVFLTGRDEEAITAQAERLAALAAKPRTPKPDPSQGSRGGSRPMTTAEQFEQQLEHF